MNEQTNLGTVPSPNSFGFACEQVKTLNAGRNY